MWFYVKKAVFPFVYLFFMAIGKAQSPFLLPALNTIIRNLIMQNQKNVDLEKIKEQFLKSMQMEQRQYIILQQSL